MAVVTRFAPSPTGLLHLGHAYSAVVARQIARAGGGVLRLRIDDIDGVRSRQEFVTSAIADLAWLGIEWTAPAWHQSTHLSEYARAVENLRSADLLYPCFCTRADLAGMLTAPHGPSGAFYPGTCRVLDDRAREERMAAHPYCWRIDMARATVRAGPLQALSNGRMIAFDALVHGDVVLARKDAPASYHLASTLDDAAMGITDVVRGADLLPVTAIHLLLQKLLDLPAPAYHHHALVLDHEGRRLAKRHASAALSTLRENGRDGPALAANLQFAILPTGYSLQSA